MQSRHQPKSLRQIGQGVALPPRNPCKKSFAAGTSVLMCDGSEKAIEDIEVGGYVLGKEESTGEVGCGLITALHTGIADDIVTLGQRSELGEISFQKATTEHPAYVIGKGFVEVGDLEIGDRIETTEGSTEVVSLLDGLWKKSVFNLTVEKYDIYFRNASPGPTQTCGPARSYSDLRSRRSYSDLRSRSYSDLRSLGWLTAGL